MSKYELRFIDYYKVRWGRKPSWSLKEAAYITCGHNPDLEEYDIALTAENYVSKRYVWLQNKSNKGELIPVGSKEGVEHYNTGSIIRLLSENKIQPDEDLQSVLDNIHMAHLQEDADKIFTRTIYREAARFIFEQFPKALIEDVAIAIEGLPYFFNQRSCGYIDKVPASTIASYLKNLTALKQKPKAEEIPKVEIDLQQLAEKL